MTTLPSTVRPHHFGLCFVALISSSVTGPPGAAADLARNFIKTGVMPTAEDNAQVTVISPGGTRGPVPDPYDVPTGLVAGDVSIVENITTSSNSTSSSLSNSPSSSLRTLPPHGVGILFGLVLLLYATLC
jgi:hypothetical protein